MARTPHRPLIRAELAMPEQDVATAQASCPCGWQGSPMRGPTATDSAAAQARSHRATAV